jgi:alpha-glucosidase
MDKGTKGVWWRDAITYQIYIRSFADSNGDGKGDVEGIRQRLPYLKRLGIDAIWITPWYPSPQKDHGYDVSDYMDIEPDYGTLADAERLIRETHEHDMRIIIDIVPNHTSDQHAWFQEALSSRPGSAARNRYIFRDGRGPNGDLPPNNWEAVFGGPAWHRVTEKDGKPGQWYLHLFAVEQPDLNWQNEEVRDYFRRVLRFWLDKGVDGFRIDVAHGMVKAEGLPDVEQTSELMSKFVMPYWDQEGVHEIYRDWRGILDSYPGDRMAVAEAWAPSSERLARYIRPDELANSFNFAFLDCKWNASEFKSVIDESIAAVSSVGAPASWVINNHDVTRSVVRYDRNLKGGGIRNIQERYGDMNAFNLERGLRRARAGALLMLALPGGAYIYQGEELGLPEVTDIPRERLTDPRWKMSGYKDPGRDGCRVPLPWTVREEGAHGFSSNISLNRSDAWLPQPSWWGEFACEKQEGEESSTLAMYRRALSIRHELVELGDGTMEWISADAHHLAFRRGQFECWVAFDKTIAHPESAHILLSSSPIEGSLIPEDTAVWLRR